MARTDIEALVSAAAAGDRSAFEALVVHFQDRALALCYGRLGDGELARDAAQDAFVDAYLHLSQLREPAAFAAWFWRVLHKHCDRRFRRLRPEAGALEQHVRAHGSDAADAELASIAGQRADWVQAAVETLPEHERLAVALHYLADQSLSEIATMLEIEPNAVKQRLHSARNRLRERSDAIMRQDMQAWRLSRSTTFSDHVALFLAVRTGDEAVVRTLLARDRTLLEASETWDVRDWPERDLPVAARATPLIRAAEAGHLGVVRALLDAGAAVDGGCGCATRETPLWTAVVTGQRAVAAELLARGADPKRAAQSGIACLHAAAIRGDRVLVELLLSHGVDREQVDGGGRCAADWARLKGHPQLLDLLEDELAPSIRVHEPAPRSSRDLFATGIKAIDLFAPLRAGSLVLVHGGAGVGRNVLLAELAEAARRRGDTASLWVLWPREAWSDGELDQLLNETQLGTHVDVLRHDRPDDERSARELPARALARCHQLLAGGARHVQVTFFERPGVRAAIEAVLPELGQRADGSAIGAFVVPPWQRGDGDAVELRAPFDTCFGFDRALAAARCFPALDAQRSRSRWLDGELADAHAACAMQARGLLADRGDERDEAARDRHARARRLRAYLTQPFHVAEAFSGRPGASVDVETLLADVHAILAGEADDLAIEDIAYRGALGRR